MNEITVIRQVETALQPRNRLASFCGFLLGGFVPVAVFCLSHFEIDLGTPIYKQFPAWIVLGGLIFSAKTVYDWAQMAFQNTWKAVGFVILAEGVMTFSVLPWLSFASLLYLIVINGVATGCLIALQGRHRLRMQTSKSSRGPRSTRHAA